MQKVVVVDDLAMHRSMIRMALGTLKNDQGIELEVIAECENGRLGLDQVSALDPDLVTLDIRMPEMDGLTSLLFLRKKLNFTGAIVMASSEDEEHLTFMRDKPVSDKIKAMSNDDKLAQLKKVEDRILSGVVEEGKINDLLTGCQTLVMDPIEYALSLGANGFLHKPYKPEQVTEVVPRALQGQVVRI